MYKVVNKNVCDSTDVTSGFLNIDKRNKFGNMAVLIEHSNSRFESILFDSFCKKIGLF